MKLVHLLLKADGRPLAIYESFEVAEAKRDQYNADPFLAPDVADLDAPYTVESWSVSNGIVAHARRVS